MLRIDDVMMGDSRSAGEIIANVQQAHCEASQIVFESTPKASRSCPSIIENSITQLWPLAESPDVVADLCFVHGLGGHPQGTWTYAKGQTSPASNRSALGNKPEKHSGFSNLLRGIGKKSRRSPGIEAVTTQPFAAADGTTTSRFWPFDFVPDDSIIYVY